jgi:hypothetical protein
MMPRGNAPRDQPHPDVGGSATNPARDNRGSACLRNEKSEVHMDTMPRILTVANGNPVMPDDRAEPPEAPGPVGARLRLFRKAIGYHRAEDAGKAVDVGRSRWLNWEAGLSLVPPYVAVRIRRIHRELCLNWLYTGDVSTLTVETLRGIEEQQRLEKQDPRNPRGCIRPVK